MVFLAYKSLIRGGDMTMTFADQVVLATHLYDHPELTKLRCAVRLPNCNAESISFFHNGTWYSILKSRGKIVAVLRCEPDKDNAHIINIGAFDRTGKRHLAKWASIKERTYEHSIPIVDVERMENI